MPDICAFALVIKSFAVLVSWQELGRIGRNLDIVGTIWTQLRGSIFYDVIPFFLLFVWCSIKPLFYGLIMFIKKAFTIYLRVRYQLIGLQISLPSSNITGLGNWCLRY